MTQYRTNIDGLGIIDLESGLREEDIITIQDTIYPELILYRVIKNTKRKGSPNELILKPLKVKETKRVYKVYKKNKKNYKEKEHKDFFNYGEALGEVWKMRREQDGFYYYMK